MQDTYIRHPYLVRPFIKYIQSVHDYYYLFIYFFVSHGLRNFQRTIIVICVYSLFNVISGVFFFYEKCVKLVYLSNAVPNSIFPLEFKKKLSIFVSVAVVGVEVDCKISDVYVRMFIVRKNTYYTLGRSGVGCILCTSEYRLVSTAYIFWHLHRRVVRNKPVCV